MPNPPTPTALRLIQGNPSGRPINKLEPKTNPGEPAMPRDLTKEARKVWKEMVPVLLKLGTLTTSDGDVLAMYCEAKVIWAKARNEINTKGILVDSQQGLKKNPACTIMAEASHTMRQLMSEFGLGAASRTKIHTSAPDQQSALSKLLNERNRLRSGTTPG